MVLEYESQHLPEQVIYHAWSIWEWLLGFRSRCNAKHLQLRHISRVSDPFARRRCEETSTFVVASWLGYHVKKGKDGGTWQYILAGFVIYPLVN